MIDFIEIKGYKSIQSMKLEVKPLNILIGANGSGKSNLLSFFEFLRNLFEQNLRTYVALRGGTEKFLFRGQKETEKLEFHISFQGGKNAYLVELRANTNKEFVFTKEELIYQRDLQQIAQRGTETNLEKTGLLRARDIKTFVSYCRKYHFHDTTANSPFMRLSSLDSDCNYYYSDGGNLAAWIYHIRESAPQDYQIIVETIRSVAPYFLDFYLKPNDGNYVSLQWKDRWSDMTWGATNLSDGTLRFIALAVLFLQPSLPDTIVIDEPELGLHPSAIASLAGMMKAAAAKGTQIIAASQSSDLISYFAPEDVLAVDLIEGASRFQRLSSEDLSEWLEEYSLGEIWERDLLNMGHINYR